MTLKSVYDSADAVPESLREYYPEKEGKFVFVGVEGYKPASEVEAVQKALNAERSEKKTLHASLSAWETKNTGKTLDEAAQLVERIPLLEAESQSKVHAKKLDQIVADTVRNRTTPLEAEI